MIQTLKNWLFYRKRTRTATGILLHATGGTTASGAINWLRQIKLSYHYIVDRDGKVTKCVPLSKVALHAGVSYGWEGNNCNEYSIGIALVNANDGMQPYPKVQLMALWKLVEDIKKGAPEIAHISTHYAVSPNRKTDPVNFPYREIGYNKIEHKLYGLKIFKPHYIHTWVKETTGEK